MSKTGKKWLCSGLMCLNLALIWGNSAMTGDDSGAMSDWLRQFLFFLPDGELGGLLLRKAAHFSEFACLGLLMGWMSLLCRDRTFPAELGLGLCCACIDETIQYFVPGRASMLLDVWIDAAGFATGLALITIGHTIRKQKSTPEEPK